MVSQNLIEFAAKNYDFVMDSFKVEYVSKWGNPPREIYTFNKNGKKYIIRFADVFPADEYICKTKAEVDFICYLAENNISVALPLRTDNGKFVISTQDNGVDHIITAIEMVSGFHWNKNDPGKWNEKVFFNWGKTMGDMHWVTKNYKPANECGMRDFYSGHYWGSSFDCLKAYPDVYSIAQKLLGEIKILPQNKDSFGLIHGDMHPDNFYIDGDKINVFDFGDSQYGWFTLDIGIALFHALWWGQKDDNGNDFTNEIVENFIKGYLSANQLSDFWISKIPIFMKYRQICCFVPWFFNPEDTEEHNQKEWRCNIENDILFDGIDLKSILKIIEGAKV